MENTINISNIIAVKNPRELRGWLLIPICNLFVATISQGYFLWEGRTQILNLDLWQKLSNYHFVFQAIKAITMSKIIYMILNFVFALLLLWCCFNRLRLFPRLMPFWYGLSVLYYGIYLIFVTQAHKLQLDFLINESELIGRIIGSLVMAMIWIPYFCISKRVKNTFQF